MTEDTRVGVNGTQLGWGIPGPWLKNYLNAVLIANGSRWLMHHQRIRFIPYLFQYVIISDHYRKPYQVRNATFLALWIHDWRGCFGYALAI